MLKRSAGLDGSQVLEIPEVFIYRCALSREIQNPSYPSSELQGMVAVGDTEIALNSSRPGIKSD